MARRAVGGRCATWLCLWLALSSCALTAKSESTFPRYYSPEGLTAVTPATSGQPASDAAVVDLKLGRVTAASDLKDNIAFREGTHEVGYYDDLLWTERPDAYLGRALSRSLFGSRARHVLHGDAPMLEVKLLAFEEIRGAVPRVRVVTSFSLRDDRTIYFEETWSEERPLAPKAGGEEVAAALGAALEGMVNHIADRVQTKLGRVTAR